MQEKTRFQYIYNRIHSIDSKTLETKPIPTRNLFSIEKDLEILEFLQPWSLQRFIKPLVPFLPKSIEIIPMLSDTETIAYNFFQSSYGELLIANTKFGICHISFASDKNIKELQNNFLNSDLKHTKTKLHQTAIDFIEGKPFGTLPLHLKGSEFQLEVWKNLLRVLKGQLTTYKHLAIAIEKPKSSIAIGAAIGKNPIALLIPCHRVIRTNGKWKGYRWGNKCKASLLIYEISESYYN